jgi:hypothetical protein
MMSVFINKFIANKTTIQVGAVSVYGVFIICYIDIDRSNLSEQCVSSDFKNSSILNYRDVLSVPFYLKNNKQNNVNWEFSPLSVWIS